VLETVGLFRYLADMLDEAGGVERAVIAWIRNSWH
jgi:hypothetical protein